MQLSVSDFKSFYPLCEANDIALEHFLGLVKEEIDRELKNIFTLTTITETDCINYKTQDSYGSSFVSIGAWQESGLTIKRLDYEDQNTASLSSDVLVLGQDYILWYGFDGDKIPGLTEPVTAIKLNCRLHKSEMLRVYGTYGWQNVYPANVKNAIYQSMNTLLQYSSMVSNNDEPVGIRRLKSMTTQIEFDEKMVNEMRKEALDFINQPNIQSVIQKYRVALQENITII